jgi:hypothetical protein
MKTTFVLGVLLIVLTVALPGVALAQGPDDPYGDDYYYYYDDYGDYGFEFGDDMPFDDYQGNFSEDIDDMRGEEGENVTARYSINQGQITLLTPDDLEQADRDLHTEIWGLVTELIPARWINNYFTEYELFAGGDTLAYVFQSEADPSLWVLGVNTAEAENRGLLAGTLIHEFAHVLMLNDMQLMEPGEACSTLDLPEGCPNPNAYLSGFYATFWTGIQLDEDGEAVPGNYDANPSAYVSDYAATNPVEDGAETFMTFVITSTQPTGGTVADQKILYFYGFPELLQLREALRANLSTLMIGDAQ